MPVRAKPRQEDNQGQADDQGGHRTCRVSVAYEPPCPTPCLGQEPGKGVVEV